ncbi:MAG: hypothetical protein J0I90_09115, partial [Nitrosospira sp.]|nr:hypothetical protein [Nitrosospira sp.]
APYDDPDFIINALNEDLFSASLKDIIRSCGLGYERTQQPPAKAEGLGLRTESQDTRWLNNAS